MKTFICKSHVGHWVAGASIVIASDIDEARKLLDEALISKGLKPRKDDPYELEEVDSEHPQAIILFDGDY